MVSYIVDQLLRPVAPSQRMKIGRPQRSLRVSRSLSATGNHGRFFCGRKVAFSVGERGVMATNQPEASLSQLVILDWLDVRLRILDWLVHIVAALQEYAQVEAIPR